VLVVCEVALSVVLVVGAGLLVRSLVMLERVDPGFDPEGAVSFSLIFPDVRYPDDQHVTIAVEAIENRLRAMPGVRVAGTTSSLALRGFKYSTAATVEGHSGEDYQQELRHDFVTPDYFRAMQTPLLGGRFFNEFDTAKSTPVAIVNRTLVKTYFQGADPVGHRIKYGRPQDGDPWVTIVGVVADARQDTLDAPVQPEAWTPLRQEVMNAMTFVLRVDSDPASLIASARREVHAVDKDLVLTQITPLTDLLRDSANEQRFRTTLLATFAGIALLLAALGVYGVLAYSVTQRTKEIGVRMALGAGTGRLFGMVVRDGFRPVLAGAVLGFLGAWMAAGLIRSLLFGVVPADPATYAVTIGILGLTALCACAIPAMRAIRVDPVISLREQ
jgi:putative ABC transport system permease protein